VVIGDEPLHTPPEEKRDTLGVPRPPDAPVKKAPAKKATAPKKTLPPWVDPDNGICPSTHPVKAKLSSGIFQVEGNFAYARTSPDRCYESPEAAAADGLRPAKR
jgi:hypothetical protein